MQDILKKYKKNKILSNLNIVLASLVLAFLFNFILIDGTNVGQSLKTSVLNSEIQNTKSDLSIEKLNDSIYIISNKDINMAESLAFSITYNPENITIKEVKSDIGDIINLGNTPGFNSIILTSENNINIKSGAKIAIIDINKREDKSENLNIINANFKDSSKEIFLLSTSGITF